MVSSRADSVEDYLSELPPDRRAVVAAVLDVVRRHMPAGYREGIQYGMIGWCVPLERYPETYNGEPLSYAALAAQKHHYALYLSSAYQDPAELAWLEEAWGRAGRRLDMGKSCVRFRSLDELPLDVVGAFVARTPTETFIARYEAARGASTREPTRKPTSRPTSKPRREAARETKGEAKRAPAREGSGARKRAGTSGVTRAGTGARKKAGKRGAGRAR